MKNSWKGNLAWALTSLAGIVLLFRALSVRNLFPYDYVINTCAAAVFRAGGDFYDGEMLRSALKVLGLEKSDIFISTFTSFISTPPNVFLYWPTSYLSLYQGRLVWLCANVLLMMAGGWLALRRVSRSEYVMALGAWMLALFQPFYSDLRLGQTSTLVFFLLVLAAVGFERRRDALAGTALGLVTVIKIYPAAIVVYLLWKKHYRVVGWAAVTFGLVMALSIAAFGVEAHRTFLLEVMPAVGKGSPHWRNQSLMGAIGRLFVPEHVIYSTASIERPAAAILGRLASGLVAAAALFALRGGSTRESFLVSNQFNLLVVTLLLVLPVTWDHYLTLAFVPILALALDCEGKLRPEGTLAGLVAFVMIGGFEIIAWPRFLSMKFLGLLGLWAIYWYRAYKEFRPRGTDL